MRPRPINTVQLWYLRNPRADGMLVGDRGTLKAMRNRGYAVEHSDGRFSITAAGRERAKYKADQRVVRDGQNLAADPSLMEDLPSTEH